MHRHGLGIGGVFVFAVLAMASAAPADMGSFGFSRLPGSINSITNVTIAENQLFMDVSDAGDGSVEFIFRNIGPQPCTITSIYFDGDVLQNITGIAVPAGVAFSIGSSPADLPGGKSLQVKFEADFGSSANNPAPHNGVNPGDWVSIECLAVKGLGFADVIAALNAGTNLSKGDSTDNTLRVGLHVQAFANGGSESLINGISTPPGDPVPVPLPPSAYAGLGMMGLMLIRRVVNVRRMAA